MYKIFISHGHSFDSHAKSQSILRLGCLCQSGSLQAIAQSSVGSGCNNLLPVSHISTTIQHGGQKSDTRAKLPEIFEAK